MTVQLTKNIRAGRRSSTFAAQRQTNRRMDINQFFIAGINYKKSDASVRGRFAISSDQYARILERARHHHLTELFVLSTCNRTEIYGVAYSPEQLIELLCSETAGDANAFRRSAYVKQGMEAIAHIFEVGAGLDSQILGDYEIVGQLKTAAKFSKEHGFIGGFLERLVNSVLQASKLIKNNTQLSGGTVSVSFAAVQYIRRHIKNVQDKNILLIGTGKIGRNTCKNLVDYLGSRNITLINRSADKSVALAGELGLRSINIGEMDKEIGAADIILVATNAPEPVIRTSHLRGLTSKLVIDLSIPNNVEPSAALLPNIRLVNVDELSRLKDETLKKREAEVPKAKAIIAELMAEFAEWYEMRRHVPMLKDLKVKLHQLHSHPSCHPTDICGKALESKIQQLLNETAGKVKMENQPGCQYIAAINEFISAQAS